MIPGLPLAAAVLSLFLAPGAAQAQVKNAADVKASPPAMEAKADPKSQSVGKPPAEQAIQPATASSTKYGDWTYECSAPGAVRKTCGLSQIIYGTGKHAGERLMTAYVLQPARDKDSKKAYVILYMPFGIDVQSDVYLSVGIGPRAAGKIDTCLQAGCRVSFALDDEGVETFRRGVSATVVFETYNGTTTAYDLSLIGFGQGYGALADLRQ